MKFRYEINLLQEFLAFEAGLIDVPTFGRVVAAKIEKSDVFNTVSRSALEVICESLRGVTTLDQFTFFLNRLYDLGDTRLSGESGSDDGERLIWIQTTK